MTALDSSQKSDRSPADHDALIFHSRFAIIFVALVFGAIAALSLVGFAYNLTINYPGTERPVIVVDPLWMLGHVIRGLGLGLVTYHLWRYQVAIKHWRGASGEQAQQVLKRHTAAWKVGAVVLAVLLVYAVSYVALGGPRV